MNLYKLGALALLIVWSAFATTMWIRSTAQAPLKCENKVLAAEVQTLKPALAEQRKEPLKQEARIVEADKAIGGINKTFAPIKESVREIPIVAGSCPGTFSDSVRFSLDQAVNAANADLQLPAAGDGGSPPRPD